MGAVKMVHRNQKNRKNEAESRTETNMYDSGIWEDELGKQERRAQCCAAITETVKNARARRNSQLQPFLTTSHKTII